MPRGGILTPGGYDSSARRSRSHGPMLPPDEDTLAAAHLRIQRQRMEQMRAEQETAEYERRVRVQTEREEYIRRAMACPICDGASNGNVCPGCLHAEAVATRGLEGFE